jgi:isoprenylcysteine carboxyl methyltransferase (ICMT) family protein YpbQ
MLLYASFFLVRLSTLFISMRNERRLKADGGIEYGAFNSSILAVLHVGFYLSAFAEAYTRAVQIDTISLVGIVIYLFSIAALFYVIHELSPIWTVKLIIGREHTLNRSLLFRFLRHPNYFLNVVPELVGLALMCKAYYTLLILFPVYIASLAVRIVQEERIMRTRFREY